MKINFKATAAFGAVILLAIGGIAAIGQSAPPPGYHYAALSQEEAVAGAAAGVDPVSLFQRLEKDKPAETVAKTNKTAAPK